MRGGQLHSAVGGLRACALALVVAVVSNAIPAQAGINEGFAFYLKGDYEAALNEWRPLAKDGNGEAANDIAYVLAAQGVNLLEALDNARIAYAAMPETAAVIDTMGWVLFRLGQYAEAVTYLEAAKAKAQRDPEVLEHLGDAYWQLGRRVDAQMQWRTAYPFASGDDLDRLRRKIAGGYEPPTPGTLAGIVLDIIPGKLFTRTPVPIRSAPQWDAAPLGVMAPGTQVLVIGVVRGKEWLAGETDGIWGYIPAGDLERTP